MSKRLATSDLNHENWDKPEKPENKGSFVVAPETELRTRVIKTAKRKLQKTNEGSDTKSIFGSFAGFSKTPITSNTSSSPFSFLSNLSKSPAENSLGKKENSSTKTVEEKTVSEKVVAAEKSVDKSIVVEQPAEEESVEKEGEADEVEEENEETEEKEEAGQTENGDKLDEELVEYYEHIRGLNMSVAEWIQLHVDENPLCILTPVFKDYERHLKEIDEKYGKKSIKSAPAASITTTKPSILSTNPTISFSSSVPKTITSSALVSSTTTSKSTIQSTPSILCKKPERKNEPEKSPNFSFGFNVASNQIKPTNGAQIKCGVKTSEDPLKKPTAEKSFTFGVSSSDSSAIKPIEKKPFTFGVSSSDNASSKPTTEKKPFTFGVTSSDSTSIKPTTEKQPFTFGVTSSDSTSVKPATEKSFMFGVSSTENSLTKSGNSTLFGFGSGASGTGLNKSTAETQFKFGIASSSNSLSKPGGETPFKINVSTSETTSMKPTDVKPFSFGLSSATAGLSKPMEAKPFTFGGSSGGLVAKSTGFNFGFSSTPFSFGFASAAAASNANAKPDTDNKPDETADDDEPPKVEFKAVVEEDSIFSMKCKVFVKVGTNYGDRGIGTIFLKPIKDKDKVQLLVRADTNLGNILLNIILSEAIPAKRLGKKDVMLMCIPTPEGEQKPTAVLLRVKTTEDADKLLEVINANKK